MNNNSKALKITIVSISLVVPLLVGILIFLPENFKNWGLDTSYLPRLNASINSLTTLLLLLALWAVKVKKIDLHKKLMFVCLGLGAMFLLSYVAYHATTASVIFGDLNHDGLRDEVEKSILGSSLFIYQFILLSHILLSFIVLPLVLTAVYFALMDKISNHKKIVRFAYPIWLYISITGVLVYMMINPYYV
jgi:putative membrane protein